MRVELRRSAIKDLKRINAADKARLHRKMQALANFPTVPNIKKLTQFEPAYRLRLGDYRILFDVSGDVVVVGRVLHRKESYK